MAIQDYKVIGAGKPLERVMKTTEWRCCRNLYRIRPHIGKLGKVGVVDVEKHRVRPVACSSKLD